MSRRANNRGSRQQRDQIERSEVSYNPSLDSTSLNDESACFLHPTTQKIQKAIMDEIYLEKHTALFSNMDRFEMVMTKPTSKFDFLTARGIFKGKFKCKNPGCTQEIRIRKKKQQPGQTKKEQDNEEVKEEANFKRQGNLKRQGNFKKLYKVKEEVDLSLKPQNAGLIDQSHRTQNINSTRESNIKTEVKVQSSNVQSQTSNPNQYQSWGQWWKKTQQRNLETQSPGEEIRQSEDVIEEEEEKEEEDNAPPGRERTKWSSSISYVTLHYCTFPVPLQEFKSMFNRDKKVKLEIFFFISLMGQKCRSCESEVFCEPDYGQTEMERIKINFATYIYNHIYGAKGGYKKCKLRRLKKHEEEYCEACYRGICGSDDFK